MKKYKIKYIPHNLYFYGFTGPYFKNFGYTEMVHFHEAFDYDQAIKNYKRINDIINSHKIKTIKIEDFVIEEYQIINSNIFNSNEILTANDN